MHHDLRTLNILHSHLLITVIIVVIAGDGSVRLLGYFRHFLEGLGWDPAWFDSGGRTWCCWRWGWGCSGRDLCGGNLALELLPDHLSGERWCGRLWSRDWGKVLVFLCKKITLMSVTYFRTIKTLLKKLEPIFSEK